ncbi:MAG: rubredoxin [Clostridia bacterium]|nr:rubredoxin [Clostridia bacterium]
MKYVCLVCGYVYDEQVEGTAFAELSDDYVCPLCGVGKDQFEIEE